MSPFRLDPRSLALCRILVGLTMVCDLLWRSTALEMHYTDLGIWPVRCLLENSEQIFPSVYLLANSSLEVVLLFLFQALAGLALTLGFRTQATTLLCWYLTRSLHTRQPMLLNGGDHLFAMLLFWAVFVPWGQCWSLDARLGHQDRVHAFSQKLATAVFAAQLPVVYWVAFVHKLEPIWLQGRGVFHALSSSFFARPSAQLLLAHPQLLVALDYAVMMAEALGPLLLLSPWARARVAAALAFAGLHLAMACFLRVGLFAWTPCLFLVALMPGSLWPSGRSRLLDLFEALARRVGLEGQAVHRLPLETAPLLVFLILLGLVQSLGYKRPSLVPDRLRWVETASGLRQDWTMFTRLDQVSDGWLILEGELDDGRLVDLLGPASALSWSAPDTLSRLPLQDRWAGYLWKVAQNSPGMPEPLLRAWMRRWGPGLRRARVVYLKKAGLTGYQDRAPQPIIVRDWTTP